MVDNFCRQKGSAQVLRHYEAMFRHCAVFIGHNIAPFSEPNIAGTVYVPAALPARMGFSTLPAMRPYLNSQSL